MDRNNREDGWMDGWMDGYMDGWMDGYMDGWMDGWMELERFCRLRFSINNWAMMHQSCFFWQIVENQNKERNYILFEFYSPKVS